MSAFRPPKVNKLSHEDHWGKEETVFMKNMIQIA